MLRLLLLSVLFRNFRNPCDARQTNMRNLISWMHSVELKYVRRGTRELHTEIGRLFRLQTASNIASSESQRNNFAERLN